MKCLILSFLVIAFVVENSDAKPLKYQSLPKKDGYVPVYIRVGNTPLEQINRDLAAAFQESNARSIRGTVIQQLNRDARFSSESSSEEAVNLIPKLLNPNYRSISDSFSNSNESNSSELLLNYIASLKPANKTTVAKTAVVSNNVI
ncbi:uncharacterized protein LOC129727177 isoform X1 [Wyeomyia smithii]|uniref:uncharacterized protein LOC129727177 isoform X1 n=1 Tax=Wyeomyia smithii TaxID=174621 RepID=UPI0024681B07|nr:uncharacterized protein LOC129727177 isoform X1 [Wyeomyia smithii]